ncbi:MAG TPA: response regulator transcription factor [Armatimonadota bacterium]
MESVVLVTDRAELRDAMRRALRQGPIYRIVTPQEWRRGEIGTTRDRLFLLDLPTPQSVRDLLPVAENWPHGFAGILLAIIGESVVPVITPSAVIDAIMVEPFSDAEAQMRVRHLLWRARMSAPDPVIAYGDLSIDTTSYEVTLCGRLLDLTYKEYELLRFLAGNPGKVFTRDMLLSRVWGEDYYGGTRTVDVHVRRLRLKLGLDHEGYIGTVRNVGYRFSAPEPE